MYSSWTTTTFAAAVVVVLRELFVCSSSSSFFSIFQIFIIVLSYPHTAHNDGVASKKRKDKSFKVHIIIIWFCLINLAHCTGRWNKAVIFVCLHQKMHDSNLSYCHLWESITLCFVDLLMHEAVGAASAPSFLLLFSFQRPHSYRIYWSCIKALRILVNCTTRKVNMGTKL